LSISFSDSKIDPKTIQAYLETEYRVQGETPTILRLGMANPGVSNLHQAHRIQSSAFITACNPLSEVLSEEVNAERNAALERELRERNLIFFPGLGLHPFNQWPGEPSFLVLGLDLEAAEALGKRFEQNAIIWNGPDAVPQLILLR